MSCSEDGSVRMWEIQDLPLAAEPASAGQHTHTHTQKHLISALQYIDKKKVLTEYLLNYNECIP